MLLPPPRGWDKRGQPVCRLAAAAPVPNGTVDRAVRISTVDRMPQFFYAAGGLVFPLAEVAEVACLCAARTQARLWRRAVSGQTLAGQPAVRAPATDVSNRPRHRNASVPGSGALVGPLLGHYFTLTLLGRDPLSRGGSFHTQNALVFPLADPFPGPLPKRPTVRGI